MHLTGMLKLFKFRSTDDLDKITEEVNSFIAEQWEDSNEEWSVAGPVTAIDETSRIIVTLVLKRKRVVVTD
jgi:hypothetical protein